MPYIRPQRKRKTRTTVFAPVLEAPSPEPTPAIISISMVKQAYPISIDNRRPPYSTAIGPTIDPAKMKRPTTKLFWNGLPEVTPDRKRTPYVPVNLDPEIAKP